MKQFIKETNFNLVQTVSSVQLGILAESGFSRQSQRNVSYPRTSLIKKQLVMNFLCHNDAWKDENDAAAQRIVTMPAARTALHVHTDPHRCAQAVYILTQSYP